MGWFDQDSDSDEEAKKTQRPLETFETVTSNFPLGVGTACTGNAKEDEDPLDSFMNSLSSTSAAAESKLKNRLDMDNEDEATAHWRDSKTDGETVMEPDLNLSKKAKRDDWDGRHTSSDTAPMLYSYESLSAKAALAQTFHKVGDGPQKPRVETTSKYDDAHEADSLRRTIDPLESVNHSCISYESFRKIFHEPNNSVEGSSWRSQNEVTCTVDIDPIQSFDQYGPTESLGNGIFATEILAYLSKNGFRDATTVQAQSIPVALAGRDLLVTSHTGSGKTLAYILPLVVHVLDQPHIVPNKDGPIAIVLTPTRELAKQVHLVAKKVMHVVGGKVCAVTGGTGTYEMSKELKKGCELIVSTPGRFIDMVKRKATNCQRITFCVLDEADKMLEMGFFDQCASILSNVRPDRQTLMFSATFGKKVERAARGWLRNPIRIAVGKTGSSSEHVDQHIIVLPSHDSKLAWLIEMLPILANVGKMIIFVASRDECDSVARKISGKGIAVDSIHGDRHQSDRNAAMTSLRKGKITALVATDVASRGLDVTGIMTVINFDPAKNMDSHVHRVGRAGRLSEKTSDNEQQSRGNAYTLLTTKNADFANSLMEAFQREGREVADDLIKLAVTSRHNGGGGRQKWNQSGLGYEDSDRGNNINVGSSHYQPSGKRSRWA